MKTIIKQNEWKMHRRDTEGSERRRVRRTTQRTTRLCGEAPTWLVACGLIALLALPPARANIMAPLTFDTVGSIVDEFGNMLEGTGDTPGARVEILSADNGIYPPNVDGTPHASNEVLLVTQIGVGVDPGVGAIGKTSGALLINRMQGTRLFARVFNKATREDSSFYGDSAIYTNPTASYGVFMIELAQTAQELDSGDDDGDGLNNSWEKSYETDKDNPDTDGDGMSDHHEVRAGTDPLDAGSYLEMVRLKAGPSAGTMVVEWDAVAGKVYQLQHAELPDGAEDFGFSNVNSAVTATSPVAATTVTNPPPGAFRVFVVE